MMTIDIGDTCTLPTAERPIRLAEFDALFTTAVRHVETISSTHTRMRMTGPTGLEATVRDLTGRETRCCSFFDFVITTEATAGGEAVTLDVQVPDAYAAGLAALTQRAS